MAGTTQLSLPDRSRVPRWLGSVATVLVVALAPSVPANAVEPTDVITRLAGNGQQTMSGDGGPAVTAALNLPRDTATGPDGSIYVADTYNQRIRRIDAVTGVITTVAGTGGTAYNGDDQLAVRATLKWPHDVTVADDGTVYVADSSHHRVRRIDPVTGMITTILGTGVAGVGADGVLGTSSQLKNPKSVALFGRALYVADLSNRVRRLDLTTGIVTTVAGTGTAGYAGDGGPALSARLNAPQRLAIDSVGNIYIADSDNNAVRRVAASSGIITTVAGTGTGGFRGDGGPGTSALLRKPRGVALDGDRVLYIADSGNHRIRRLDLATGTIRTIAGSTRGSGGDGGPASAAHFDNPRGLTVDSAGRLIIADTFNSVIRVITPTAP
jgi:sugar lactone lactonase YvrE